MKNPDQLWFDLVYRFAEQSKCKSRKVGCVIVDEHGHQFAQGWNSAPKGSTTDECPRCQNKVESGKDLQLAICAHAEANAIHHAAKVGHATNRSTLYCTTLPCSECAKAIIGAGIIEVVYDKHYDSPLTIQMFTNAGVKFRRFQL